MNVHEIVTTYKAEGGTSQVKAQAIAAQLSQSIESEVAAGAINVEFDIVIPFAQIKAFLLSITKKSGQAPAAVAGPMTIKTNSTTTPDDTFVIKTDLALAYGDGDPSGNPVGVDITKIYVTNPGDAVADFVLRALLDPTP